MKRRRTKDRRDTMLQEALSEDDNLHELSDTEKILLRGYAKENMPWLNIFEEVETRNNRRRRA